MILEPVSSGHRDLRVSAVSAGSQESKNRKFSLNGNIILNNKKIILKKTSK
jgi:hypothetical protein